MICDQTPVVDVNRFVIFNIVNISTANIPGNTIEAQRCAHLAIRVKMFTSGSVHISVEFFSLCIRNNGTQNFCSQCEVFTSQRRLHQPSVILS